MGDLKPPAKVMVDLENCGFPADIPPEKCIYNIRMTLLHLGFSMHSNITAFTFKDEYRQSLKEKHEGLEVVQVKADPKDPDRDHADLRMKEEMLSWCLRHKGPAALLVVTCDKDFLPVMKLVKDSGITLLHSYSEGSTGPNLIRCTEKPIKWRDLVTGKLLPDGFRPDDFSVPQTPPSPPHRGPPPPIENSQSKLKTFYDIGSCPLPVSISSCVSLRQNINDVLPHVVGGFAGILEMAVYFKTGYFEESKLKQQQKVDLEKGKNIDLISVEPPPKGKGNTGNKKIEGQDYPDQLIKRLIYSSFLMSPEVPVLLISNDERFASVLGELEELDYPIVLAHNEHALEELTQAVPMKVHWELLAGGVEGKLFQDYIRKKETEEYQETGVRGPFYMAWKEKRRQAMLEADQAFYLRTGKEGSKLKKWDENAKKREDEEDSRRTKRKNREEELEKETKREEDLGRKKKKNKK